MMYKNKMLSFFLIFSIAMLEIPILAVDNNKNNSEKDSTIISEEKADSTIIYKVFFVIGVVALVGGVLILRDVNFSDGINNTIAGLGNYVIGNYNKVSGNYNHIYGNNNNVSGIWNKVYGNNNLVERSNITVSGNNGIYK